MFGWLRSKLARSQVAGGLLAEQHAAEEHESTPSIGASAPPESTGPVKLSRQGQGNAAKQAATAALEANPAHPEGLLASGLHALDRGGRPTEALRVLERAAVLAPSDPAVQIALGRANVAANRRSAARAAFQRASELAPRSGEPLLQLALLSLASGPKDEAATLLDAAVRAEPRLAEAHFQLGNLKRERGRLEEAERHYRSAIAARADHVGALSNLGGLLSDRGSAEEAARHLEQALRLEPTFAPPSFTLAMLCINQRRWGDAAGLLRSSLAADPKQADARYWLGNAEMGLGNVAEARKAYQAAIRLDGNYLQARWGHVMAQIPAVASSDEEQCNAPQQFARELTKLRTWLRTRRPPDSYRAVGAQQPYYLAYVPENHREAFAEYGTLCTALMANSGYKPRSAMPVRSLGSKCRIGIVSAHVHSHSVWHAILRGWIEHLDPAQFEIHLFHTGTLQDAETEWASRRVARLHFGLGDWAAWVPAISGSALDVLVYPEIGMDATTVRLASLRLAKVQLASWGHPITTGLPTIDGFLSSEAFEPADATTHYTEKLISLPRLGCCYRPFGTKHTRVDLSVWGIRPEDRVLLCAGSPFKYSPHADALLVAIARRCQPCKLIFFRSPEPLAALLERRLRQAFDAAGLMFDDCVRFVPWLTQTEFFGLLHRADVYLDSVGFSGFNTTMQAVECGIPIVAWEGRFMRGRFASGILRQAGLDQWVADTSEGYVGLVAHLSEDRQLRNDVRDLITTRRARLIDDRAVVSSLAERLLALSASN